MKKYPVAFIAFEDYDNLGVGYLASILSIAGYEPVIINILLEKEEVLKILKNKCPVLVGFSIIFQNHFDRFEDLILYLRMNEINCHFTAGGHFATLKYRDLFSYIPGLDSIVRFEGEYTLLDLVKNIVSGNYWKQTNGIVYKDGDVIITNPLRPMETDLDHFPYPVRSHPKKYAFNKKFATLIASRGCVHNCSFCNSREFYRKASGPLKRNRDPVMVVKEMEFLNRTQDCTVFLFEDDDFPVKPSRDPGWIIRFCDELEKNGLSNKFMWKINCRPDAIDENLFNRMKYNGLELVFLGIEDGTDAGLSRLNKHMTISQSLNGINVLKKLKIGFDFGFILFQPDTTYKSLNENLDFLIQICGDGYTPVNYFKLKPYFETRVERELIKSGRLIGTPSNPDYAFQDNSLNDYYEYVMSSFNEWIRYTHGLTNLSKWARNYFLTYSRFYSKSYEFIQLNKMLVQLIAESNLFFLNEHKRLASMFEKNRSTGEMRNSLQNYSFKVKQRHEYYMAGVSSIISGLIQLRF